MKKLVFMFFVAASLAACSSVPQPPQPNENNRVPVNKTVPIEIQK